MPMTKRQVKTAKAICRDCPVRLDCLFTALDQRESFGVWGGMSSGDRKRLVVLAKGDTRLAMFMHMAGALPSSQKKEG